MTRLRRLLPMLCLSLLLPACGGGGGGGSDPKPIANAGPDQTVEMGATVALDGSASSTSRNGATLTYDWTLVAKPDGSAAALSDAHAQKPTFVADEAGAYEADLVVNDGEQDSGHDRVDITATNPDPTAVVANPVQNVLLGATVTLDGSGSVPPTGGSTSGLIYQWTLTSKPSGSLSTVADAGAAATTLIPDTIGAYTLTLVVKYGDKSSAPVTVTVNTAARNTAPVADAGGPYTIERGKTLMLDGSKSSDADGDALSYRWTFLYSGTSALNALPTSSDLPKGSKSVLQNANTVHPTFTGDVAGSYSVMLLVFDGTSLSQASTATITVTKPDGAANTPPVAVLTTQPNEVELGGGPYGADYNPSGSQSYDIDGDALTYKWSWVSTPAGFDQNDPANSSANWKYSSPSFKPNVAGDYTVQLIVNDGQADSAPVQGTVKALVGANRVPQAIASTDLATVMVGTTATFSGAASNDQDGNQLSYRWDLVDRPDGSSATLQNATSVSPSLIPDKAGPYSARLVVTDSHGASSIPSTIVTVMAKAHNEAPIVRPSAATWAVNQQIGKPAVGTDEQPYVLGQQMPGQGAGANIGDGFTFLSNAFDADGDNLYYLWTLTAQPEGSNFPASYSPSTPGVGTNWLFNGVTVPGTYTVSVVASDGIAKSDPQTVSVKVVDRADYPNLLLEYGGLKTDSPSLWMQQLFPYSWSDWQMAVAPLKTQFRLTAYDQDYTITGLEAATAGGDAPLFEGLADGQVIKKGETVNFNLLLPASFAYGSTPSFDFKWVFSIKEKPDWTFQFEEIPCC